MAIQGCCVALINSAAERGTDRVYNTVYATSGRDLYERGLSSGQQSIVDEAQTAQTIDFKQEAQVAAVRDIVNLIAIGPSICTVCRLISSFQKVATCLCKRSEDLLVSVLRFRGLTADI